MVESRESKETFENLPPRQILSILILYTRNKPITDNNCDKEKIVYDQAAAELDQAQQSWDWGGMNWLVAEYIGKESKKNILFDTGLKPKAWTERFLYLLIDEHIFAFEV